MFFASALALIWLNYSNPKIRRLKRNEAMRNPHPLKRKGALRCALFHYLGSSLQPENSSRFTILRGCYKNLTSRVFRLVCVEAWPEGRPGLAEIRGTIVRPIVKALRNKSLLLPRPAKRSRCYSAHRRPATSDWSSQTWPPGPSVADPPSDS